METTSISATTSSNQEVSTVVQFVELRSYISQGNQPTSCLATFEVTRKTLHLPCILLLTQCAILESDALGYN